MENKPFTNEQFQKIYPDGIENHYWNHARNNIILRFLKKHGINREPILEIGGGRGVVSRFLHENLVDITGVELAAVIPVTGTEGYFFAGTDAFSLHVDKAKRYTVIMLLDVIEHIEKPAEFIEKILQHFIGVKYILITVPARQELWTNYDEYNGHYRRYNLADLRHLSHGKSRLISAGYFNHVLYPVFWLYARLIKSRETVLKAPNGWMIGVHRVLSWVLQADYFALPCKLPGTSVIGLISVL